MYIHTVYTQILTSKIFQYCFVLYYRQIFKEIEGLAQFHNALEMFIELTIDFVGFFTEHSKHTV